MLVSVLVKAFLEKGWLYVASFMSPLTIETHFMILHMTIVYHCTIMVAFALFHSVNILWSPTFAIFLHRTGQNLFLNTSFAADDDGSSLVLVIDVECSAPSHYLNWWWLNIDGLEGTGFSDSSNKIQDIAFIKTRQLNIFATLSTEYNCALLISMESIQNVLLSTNCLLDISAYASWTSKTAIKFCNYLNWN